MQISDNDLQQGHKFLLKIINQIGSFVVGPRYESALVD
jgi:hypothetical protein